MKCSKCGAELMNNAISCVACGTFFGYNNNYSSQNAVQTPKSKGNGTGALVLGILALVFDVLTCLIFPLGLVSLILGIIGIVLGNKNKGVPKADTGKLLSIIALSILVVCVIIGVILLALGVAIEYESRPWYEKLQNEIYYMY